MLLLLLLLLLLRHLAVIDFAVCSDAGLAEALDKKQGTPVDVGDERFKAELRYEPVGVVAAIIPFNYPNLMLTWKCTLMSRACVDLSHCGVLTAFVCGCDGASQALRR
jgi:hypothetical protein